MGHDGLLFLAYHIGQEGPATCCTDQSDSFLSRGILTAGSLALAGVVPENIHRSHDAWSGLSLDRPSGHPDWHRPHFFSVLCH